MVMLSTLERFKIADAGGQAARVIDFVVSLHHGDYPPVTRLIYKHGGAQKSLAWEAVKKIDWDARKFIVDDFKAGEKINSDKLAQEILLSRDVRDSMVLDLQNRRATRANDLWLEEEQGKLVLRGADLTARAMLRHMTGDRFFRHVDEKEIYDWKYVEFLRGDPHDVENAADCNLRIARLPPGEISLLLSALPYLHAAELLVLLPDELAADVFEFMPPDRQLQVFEELNDEQSLKLLSVMRSNFAVSLLSRLNPKEAHKFLKQLPARQSESFIELLRYPEDTVGGMMTNEFAFVRADLTVKQAREELKGKLEKTDFAFLTYVVEDEKERRLCGAVSLRDILIADDEKQIREIMDEYVTTLQPLEPAREAAYRVLNTHLAAMPVVNHEGSLLGVVTIDAALANVTPAGWNGQAPRVFA